METKVYIEDVFSVNLMVRRVYPDEMLGGKKEIKSVQINPDVLDDVDMLQDLVLTAVNEALRKVDSAQAQTMGRYNIPGLM